jgi:YggT family protein
MLSLIINIAVGLLYAVILLVFIRAALSFISPYPTNEPWRLLIRVTEPMLAPIRRRLPPVSGFDLSPLVVTLVAFFLIAALRSIS